MSRYNRSVYIRSTAAKLTVPAVATMDMDQRLELTLWRALAVAMAAPVWDVDYREYNLDLARNTLRTILASHRIVYPELLS